LTSIDTGRAFDERGTVIWVDDQLLAAASSVETMDVEPILTALAALANRPECQPQVSTLEAVVAAYRQLAAL
jgi:hypothetical protein